MKRDLQSFLIFISIMMLPSFVAAQPSPGEGTHLIKQFHSPQARDWGEDGLHVFSETTVIIIDTNPVPKDFFAELKTDFINGNNQKSYGLIFSARDSLNYFAFLVLPSGKYSLQERSSNKFKHYGWSNIIPWTSDTNIIKNGVNYLKVRCVKDSIQLFINGQPVKAIREKNNQNGKIGLYAEEGVHVHFSELIISAKPLKTDYRFTPNIDSLMHFKRDSATKQLYDFIENKPDWNNEPDNFFERGFYRSQYSELFPHHNITCGMENFTFEMNVRILRWDSAGLFRIMYHVGTYSHEEKGISIESDSVVKYFNFFYTADNQPIVSKIPFEYDSGRIVHLKLEVQDTDTKLWIDGTERILFIDERFTEPVRGYIKIFMHRITVDILGIRISSRPIDEYGLTSTMPTCLVYRLSPPKESTYKPFVRKEKSKNPVVRFFKKLERDMDEWFWVMIFALASLLIYIFIFVFIRIRRNRKYKIHFETMFLKYMETRNGSAGIKQIAKHFSLSSKKALNLINRIADKHQIVRQIVGNDDLLVVIPGFMIAIPEAYEPILQRMTDTSSRYFLTHSEARNDLLTLMRIASINDNRLSIDILRKEFEAQPDRIHLLHTYVSKKPHEFEATFNKAIQYLFNVLIDPNHISFDPQLPKNEVIIEREFLNTFIELNK